jgi:hypothetical protein
MQKFQQSGAGAHLKPDYEDKVDYARPITPGNEQPINQGNYVCINICYI